MQKRAVLSGRLSFVHTVYPIFKVHSSDFFSNIFFLSRSAYALGKKFLCPLSRHFLHMGSPKIFNFWGERRHKSPNVASDILCYLVAERESSPSPCKKKCEILLQRPMKKRSAVILVNWGEILEKNFRLWLK